MEAIRKPQSERFERSRVASQTVQTDQNRERWIAPGHIVEAETFEGEKPIYAGIARAIRVSRHVILHRRGPTLLLAQAARDRPVILVNSPETRHARRRRLVFEALNNLEIPLHLPIGDGAAELAFFPVAGRGVVVDEGIAEKGPGGL